MKPNNEAVLREALTKIKDFGYPPDAKVAHDALAATATVSSAEQPAGECKPCNGMGYTDGVGDACAPCNGTGEASYRATMAESERRMNDPLQKALAGRIAAPISEDTGKARKRIATSDDIAASEARSVAEMQRLAKKQVDSEFSRHPTVQAAIDAGFKPIGAYIDTRGQRKADKKVGA